MEPEVGRNETCPLGVRDGCPCLPQPGPGPRALMVRVDLHPDGGVVCACHAAGSEAGPIAPLPRDLRTGYLAPPHLIDPSMPLPGIDRKHWEALRGLLRTPLLGMAALGLASLPDRVQDLLLAALHEEREVRLRINADPAALRDGEMTFLGLRALCESTGIVLSIRGPQPRVPLLLSTPGIEEPRRGPTPAETAPASPSLGKGHEAWAPLVWELEDASGGPSGSGSGPVRRALLV